MPISVAEVVQKRYLFPQDPEGTSWVDLKPVTERMERQRAAMLTKLEIGYDGGYIVQRIIVNTRDLENLELWLTFAAGHIELAIKKEDGEIESQVLFDKEKMTLSQFTEQLEILGTHAPAVRRSWIDAVHDHRPGWYLPF